MATLGIDLGTTNSCAASVRLGAPQILPNSEGKRLTPSVVAMQTDGDPLVGGAAHRQAAVNPRRTFFSIKRFIGRLYNSPGVQDLLAHVPFEVGEAPTGDVRFDIDGSKRSPEELSAYLLRRLRADAEVALDTEVNRSVVTVPAFFDDRQRQATKDAGRIAGLESVRVINEPTAAALAYGLSRPADRRVAVYDLGGGTFDISIVEQQGRDFRVLSTAGDAFLGGDDFDRMLLDWLSEEFERHYGERIPPEAMVLRRLWDAVEAAKRHLSVAELTQITVPFVMGTGREARHLDMSFPRSTFEHLVAPLVERTLKPCADALSDAGLGPEELDGVILVGGQTRSPIVLDRVMGFFDRPVVKGINPDEAVALGAALTAAIDEGLLDEARLEDVVPLSLGIETVGGQMTRIIRRNTPVPARATRVFTTTEDDRPVIRLHVLQGEQPLAMNNRSLGMLDLIGIRPAPRGKPRIEIAFEVDDEGLLHVSARDRVTGRAQQVHTFRTGGLTDAEIAQLSERAQDSHEEGEAARDWVAVKNQALNLVLASLAILDDPESGLVESFRRRLVAQVHELRAGIDGSPDADDLLRRCETVRRLLREIDAS